MKSDPTLSDVAARVPIPYDQTSLPVRVLAVARALRACIDELDELALGPASLHVSRALLNLRELSERDRFLGSRNNAPTGSDRAAG